MELNHIYSLRNRKWCLDSVKLIGWEWREEFNDFVVVDSRFWDRPNGGEAGVIETFAGGRVRCTFIDDEGVMRRIEAGRLSVSHTWWDRDNENFYVASDCDRRWFDLPQNQAWQFECRGCGDE